MSDRFFILVRHRNYPLYDDTVDSSNGIKSNNIILRVKHLVGRVDDFFALVLDFVGGDSAGTKSDAHARLAHHHITSSLTDNVVTSL